MTPSASPNLYKHYRFPGEIISHAVWLYVCFPLSHPDVEELGAIPTFRSTCEKRGGSQLKAQWS
jgi:transposase-like protein